MRKVELTPHSLATSISYPRRRASDRLMVRPRPIPPNWHVDNDSPVAQQGLRLEFGHGLEHDGSEQTRTCLGLHVSSLHLREVQHAVDQRQKMPAIVLNPLDVPHLPGGESPSRILVQDVRETDDGVA
jgi:hypothetical protein